MTRWYTSRLYLKSWHLDQRSRRAGCQCVSRSWRLTSTRRAAIVRRQGEPGWQRTTIRTVILSKRSVAKDLGLWDTRDPSAGFAYLRMTGLWTDFSACSGAG